MQSRSASEEQPEQIDGFPYRSDGLFYSLWKYANADRLTPKQRISFLDVLPIGKSSFWALFEFLYELKGLEVELEDIRLRQDIYAKHCKDEYERLAAHISQNPNTLFSKAAQRLLNNQASWQDILEVFTGSGLLRIRPLLIGIFEFIEFAPSPSEKNTAPLRRHLEQYIQWFIEGRLVALNSKNLYQFSKQKEIFLNQRRGDYEKYGQTFLFRGSNYGVQNGSIFVAGEDEEYLFVHTLAALEQQGLFRIEQIFITDMDVPLEKQTNDYKVKISGYKDQLQIDAFARPDTKPPYQIHPSKQINGGKGDTISQPIQEPAGEGATENGDIKGLFAQDVFLRAKIVVGELYKILASVCSPQIFLPDMDLNRVYVLLHHQLRLLLERKELKGLESSFQSLPENILVNFDTKWEHSYEKTLSQIVAVIESATILHSTSRLDEEYEGELPHQFLELIQLSGKAIKGHDELVNELFGKIKMMKNAENQAAETTTKTNHEKMTLKNSKLSYEDDRKTVCLDNRKLALTGENEQELCRFMFSKAVSTPICWDLIYEAMFGTSPESENKKSQKKKMKSIQDTARRVNKKIKEGLVVSEDLFKWRNKSLSRIYGDSPVSH